MAFPLFLDCLVRHHGSLINPLGACVKKVLIVEDQAEIRELVRVTLEFERYAIHEAEDGASALDEAQRVRPDVILLDLMLPGNKDGLQVCRAVKADPNLRKTKVVMLTSRSEPADRSAGTQAGADAYLVKPFSPLELLTVVHKII